MDNKNLFLAILLSIGILVGYQYLYVKPQQEHYRQQAIVDAEKRAQEVKPEASADNAAPRARSEIIADSQRVKIATPDLEGSINLRGASLDDLLLVNYRENTDAGAPAIALLSPAGSAEPHRAYYAEFSWLSGDAATPVPTAQTIWKANGKELTPSSPLTLSWDNGHGLTFERIIAVDDRFMFTITDNVRNSGSAPATLYPFGFIRRQGNPVTRDIYVSHEGPLGVLNGTLEEYKYKDLVSAGKKTGESDGGWLGITDKYWLVALIPPQDEKLATEFAYTGGGVTTPGNDGFFQTDFRGAAMTVAPGASISHATQLFAGAKLLRQLDHYEEQYKIPHFDRAIDFGWFYFLTKPFLYLLDMLGSLLGNFGLAILAFTVMLKLVTLPLSIKSYRAMARMKALQPQLKAMQERYGDDKAKQGAEMMELYRREGVNPASGCLPTLIQIPIFFALYKVLYVGIEMWQAPFYGWIHDLSKPDPTSIVTLFGLFPSAGPAVHHMIDVLKSWPSAFSLFGVLPTVLSSIALLGVCPIFMGLSMFLQQRLSPQPPDKAQARIFMFMPIVFTFMLSQMPAGLVIYWTWSNLLSIAQQWFIMRHTGVKRK